MRQDGPLDPRPGQAQASLCCSFLGRRPGLLLPSLLVTPCQDRTAEHTACTSPLAEC